MTGVVEGLAHCGVESSGVGDVRMDSSGEKAIPLGT